MALSAAYRTGQRFGVNHLIDVLQGNTTDKVRQFRHEALPTFGVGSGLDAMQWRSVFRQLVARGHLSVAIDQFGALTLESRCRPVLKGEEQIEFRRDRLPAAKKQTVGALPADIDVVLWEALRDCRRGLADDQGVPPYVVFHDSTLKEMCVRLPRDLVAFGDLGGVGERKLNKYGEAFLDVIRAHLAGPGSEGIER